VALANPFPHYAELIRTSSAFADVAAAHRRIWTQTVREVPDGGTALVISSGGAIEPSLVACLPDADHAGWGAPFGHCGGVRLTYADGRFVSAVLRRTAVAS
jgi:broad specificity phosphatase PhoE